LRRTVEHETFGHWEILEAMESCRPDSDDLFDPALAPLVEVLTLDADLADCFQRQQHADAAVASAFRDVAVPDGLAERLLGRLAEARKEGTVPISASATMGLSPLRGVGPTAEIALRGLAPAAAATATAADRQRRFLSRRWWTAAAAALSTAAVLLTAAWVWVEIRHRAAYTPLAVLDEATEFFSGESPRTGSKPGEVSPPGGYPISRGILRTSQVRWRPIQGLLGCTGVAYDLSAPGDGRATLYVVSQAVPGLPTQPPREPRPTTAGCSAAAWQENGLLYVFVVDGGPGVYRTYLRLPSGPLT
jgi:hypothetical protein